MELPQRPEARVNAFDALEQLTPDGGVLDRAVFENRTRDGNCPLGIVGRLANAPLALRVADIPGNHAPRPSFEPPDAVRVPSPDALARQRFGLFADGVADGDTFETTEDSRVADAV
jgi:hypothetical protein